MTHKEVKAPRLLSDDSDPSGSNGDNSPKRPRTQEDFYRFCSIILEYEDYERLKKQEEESRTATRTPPPLDSSGSSVNSESATSSGQEDNKISEDETDVEEQDAENNEDSYDLVTCYCRKPFAGRPMIECSRCLTWVHLSCARVRRTHIPEVFFCALCKSQRHRNARNTESATRPPRTSPNTTPQLKKMKRGTSL